MTDPAALFVIDALATLRRSAERHDGALRTLQLASSGPDGTPRLRTVVLRRLGAAGRPVTEIHSDARAGKIADLERNGHAALLAWSAAEALQLRLDGQARIHRGDDLARKRWAHLSEAARKPYGLRAPPGSPIGDPEDVAHLPDDERFAAFAIVLVEVTRVDVLRLGSGGSQVRAEARFDDAGMIEATWLAP